MKKLSKILLILILMVTIITGCTTNNKTDATKFKEEYESKNNVVIEKTGKTIRSIEVSKYNPFVYKGADELADMIDNKETFIVYFGFAECPWCRSVLPTLIKVANDLGIDKIYYVDVQNIRDTKTVSENGEVVTDKEGSEGYNRLINKIGNVLNDYSLTDKSGNKVATSEKRIYAPNVVTVIDGVATGMDSGISSLQTDGYMELSDEMINETYNKFKKLLTPISEIVEKCDNSGC